MPTVANGIDLEADLRRARADNLELEWKPQWFQGLETHIRPLAYLNHANMGDYGQAIAALSAGRRQGSRHHPATATRVR